MRTYPQLTYLAEAYFHQDYDLDAPTPAGIIATFADGEELGASWPSRSGASWTRA